MRRFLRWLASELRRPCLFRHLWSYAEDGNVRSCLRCPVRHRKVGEYRGIAADGHGGGIPIYKPFVSDQ